MSFSAAIVYFSGNLVYIVFGTTKEQSWNNYSPNDRDHVEYEQLNSSDNELESD